ncbi:MAG TPA: protein kinase [Candidatus Obscuribacterales bacterium]
MPNRLEAEKNWDQSFRTATTYLMADRLPEAERDFKSAVAQAEALGDDEYRLIQSLNGLALTYFKKKDLDFAEPTYLRTVELADQLFGENDARVLPYLTGFAFCLITAKKYMRALPVYERALGMTEKVRGRLHPDLSAILRNLGLIYEQLQKLPEAKKVYEHLAEIYDTTNPADSATIRLKISRLGRPPAAPKKPPAEGTHIIDETDVMPLQPMQDFASPTKKSDKRPTSETPGKGGVSGAQRQAGRSNLWDALVEVMSTDVVEAITTDAVAEKVQSAIEQTGQRRAARSGETTGQRPAALPPGMSGQRPAASSAETTAQRKAAPSPQTSGQRPAAPSPETTGQRKAASLETTGQRKNPLVELAQHLSGQFKKVTIQSDPGVKAKGTEPDVRASNPQGVSLEKRDDLIGRVIENRYRIDDYIGAGGMSVVYKGTHIMMGRPVAIKMMQSHLAEKEELLQRFQQEARAAHSLSHPNIATAHDFGMTEDGLFYLVMDYVEGKSLEDLLNELGHIPVARCVPILTQICDAVGYAHDNGFVHRDLKPSNIMLLQSGGKVDVVKIVDFGLAKLINKDPELMKLTRTGEFVGSPLYTSPEQLRGQTMDGRSDLYSLGLVAYECLTGKSAVAGETYSEVLVQHFAETPKSFAEQSPGVSIPQAVEKAVFKAIEKDPGKRHASMADFKKELEAAAM